MHTQSHRPRAGVLARALTVLVLSAAVLVSSAAAAPDRSRILARLN